MIKNLDTASAMLKNMQKVNDTEPILSPINIKILQKSNRNWERGQSQMVEYFQKIAKRYD